jgi:hypothetical protein
MRITGQKAASAARDNVAAVALEKERFKAATDAQRMSWQSSSPFAEMADLLMEGSLAFRSGNRPLIQRFMSAFCLTLFTRKKCSISSMAPIPSS